MLKSVWSIPANFNKFSANFFFHKTIIYLQIIYLFKITICCRSLKKEARPKLKLSATKTEYALKLHSPETLNVCNEIAQKCTVNSLHLSRPPKCKLFMLNYLDVKGIDARGQSNASIVWRGIALHANPPSALVPRRSMKKAWKERKKQKIINKPIYLPVQCCLIERWGFGHVLGLVRNISSDLVFYIKIYGEGTEFNNDKYLPTIST